MISVPDLLPPVGTWQHYDFDPRARWPWTAWERHAEGTYLVSAGATYQAGKGYGSNTHALTASEMPDEISVWQGTKQVAGNNASLTAQGIWSHGERLNKHNLATCDAGHPHNNMPQSIAVPLWHRTG